MKVIINCKKCNKEFVTQKSAYRQYCSKQCTFNRKGKATKEVCFVCSNKYYAKNMCRLHYKKDYSKKNRQRMNQLSRKWAENNPEKRKFYVARYDKSEKNKIRRRLWLQVNKENQKKWWKNYYQTEVYKNIHHVNSHKRRAMIKGLKEHYKRKEWEILKRTLGNMCLSCGQKEPRIQLTVDHIIPISLGGSNIINNIQPLCLSCNLKKHNKIIDFRNFYTKRTDKDIIELTEI